MMVLSVSKNFSDILEGTTEQLFRLCKIVIFIMRIKCGKLIKLQQLNQFLFLLDGLPYYYLFYSSMT